MLIYIFIFILGTMIGSFLNVVIYRLPNGKSVVTPRSSCTSCGRMIPWYENIPLFSYLFLRGRCKACKASISVKYLFIELVTGLIFFLVSLNYHPLDDLLMWLILVSIASIFICHFFIDLEHHLLLDSLNTALFICAVVLSIRNGEYLNSLAGGLIGFLGPFIISITFLKLKGKVGLGGGDVKLFGVLGIILGPFGVALNLFLSSFLGSIITLLLMAMKKVNKKSPFAFGPYILLVACVQIFTPELFSKISHFLFPD